MLRREDQSEQGKVKRIKMRGKKNERKKRKIYGCILYT